LEWHEKHPLLAVSSYSQDRGGFVTIYDELVFNVFFFSILTTNYIIEITSF
jgi:hypothetical protein